jgi:hypothetical protein
MSQPWPRRVGRRSQGPLLRPEDHHPASGIADVCQVVRDPGGQHPDLPGPDLLGQPRHPVTATSCLNAYLRDDDEYRAITRETILRGLAGTIAFTPAGITVTLEPPAPPASPAPWPWSSTRSTTPRPRSPATASPSPTASSRGRPFNARRRKAFRTSGAIGRQGKI